MLYCPDTCQPNSNFPCVYCDTAGCCHSAGQVGTGFECTNHAASTSCSASDQAVIQHAKDNGLVLRDYVIAVTLYEGEGGRAPPRSRLCGESRQGQRMAARNDPVALV